MGDNFLDATIGRSVVSWGEATFIPITANGLVTGALDITKLRAPGSSIKEALLPVEQIVLSTNVDGVGIEAYYQLQSDMVKVDVAGSFFGSEVVGKGHVGIEAFKYVMKHPVLKELPKIIESRSRKAHDDGPVYEMTLLKSF